MNMDLGEHIKSSKNSNETRRAKYNMIFSVTGGFFLLIGVILLVVKGLSVEYIDAQGILHENFFLLPLGVACIFCGLIFFVIVGIRWISGRLKSVN